ncbi:MAG: hypothetical protein WD080_11100 [Egibacteraceae bacterium]
MDEELQRRWHEVTGPMDIDDVEALRVLDDLAGRYGEQHRAFHTLAHIRHVLEMLDFLEGREAVDDPLAVRLAAWFHDAVYEPGAADNEAASARLAAEALTNWQVPSDRVAHVHQLILVTADHRPEAGDEALLCDADLAVLAADPDTYEIYTRAVRVEHAHLDDDAWRAGRTAFLRALLDRQRLFATTTMRHRGEEIARANLAAELEQLDAADA